MYPVMSQGPMSQLVRIPQTVLPYLPSSSTRDRNHGSSPRSNITTTATKDNRRQMTSPGCCFMKRSDVAREQAYPVDVAEFVGTWKRNKRHGRDSRRLWRDTYLTVLFTTSRKMSPRRAVSATMLQDPLKNTDQFPTRFLHILDVPSCCTHTLSIHVRSHVLNCTKQRIPVRLALSVHGIPRWLKRESITAHFTPQARP